MFKTVSSKANAIIIIITLAALIVASAIYYFCFTTFSLREKEKMLIENAELIASVYAVQSENLNGEIVYPEDNLDKRSVFIWVCNKDGQFIGCSGPVTVSDISELPEQPRSLVSGTLLTSKKFITQDFSGIFGRKVVTAGVPFIEGENTGVILLHSYYNLIDSGYLNGQIMLVVSAVVLFTIAFIIKMIIIGKAKNQIKTLRKAMTGMASGDFETRVQFDDSSELSTLAYGFNNLATSTGTTVTKLQNETIKLSNIINNVSDGLASYDLSLRLVTYNSALLKLCKEDYFQRPEIKEALTNVMQDGQIRTIILEDEEILKFTFTQIKSNNVVEGAVVIVSDISQSERLERLRREFVANVSHEFRTPLTIIQGYVEALIDGAVTDPEIIHGFYERIYSETSALERLVKDLLDTSRFKSGKIKLKQTKVDVDELLTNLVDNLQAIAKEKNIHLVYEHTDINYFYVDYDRIRQIIIIFIDNAIKFTPEDGFITVSAYEKGNFGYICFKDTGVGMAEEDIPFIFERFYKVDKSRGGSETGTGLGLSIAAEIVKLHGGEIKVESHLGKGTLFKVKLPLYVKENIEPTEE